MWQTNEKSKLRTNDLKTIIPLHQAALYIMDCWWLLMIIGYYWLALASRSLMTYSWGCSLTWPKPPGVGWAAGIFSNNFTWICLDSEPFQSYSIIIESTPSHAFRLCSSCVPHAPLPPLPQEFRTMTMSLPHCWHCWPPCPGVATESIKPLPAAAKRHSTLARATQATRMPGCHVPSKVLHTVCQDMPRWPPCDHVTRITHIYIYYIYITHVTPTFISESEAGTSCDSRCLGTCSKTSRQTHQSYPGKWSLELVCRQLQKCIYLHLYIKLARQSTKIGARMQSCQCIAFIVVS